MHPHHHSQTKVLIAALVICAVCLAFWIRPYHFEPTFYRPEVSVARENENIAGVEYAKLRHDQSAVLFSDPEFRDDVEWPFSAIENGDSMPLTRYDAGFSRGLLFDKFVVFDIRYKNDTRERVLLPIDESTHTRQAISLDTLLARTN